MNYTAPTLSTPFGIETSCGLLGSLRASLSLQLSWGPFHLLLSTFSKSSWSAALPLGPSITSTALTQMIWKWLRMRNHF